MSQSTFKNILSGSVWGIISKAVDAIAKFVTIPLLVQYYGKLDYSLVALAFSLNAYLRLMDMGMNVGTIRFYSMWLANDEIEKIEKISKSSIVFYGIIGLINTGILIYMAHFSGNYFKIPPQQQETFRWMMYILASSTVLNWLSSVFIQLLSAHQQIAWINKVAIISGVLNFLTAYIAVALKLTLPTYYFLYILSTVIIIPFYIYKLNVYGRPVLNFLKPIWNGPAYKEVLMYSLGLFALSIFQFSADNLRPILLGKYASKGLEVLTDYRVIQTLCSLVAAVAAVLLQVVVPSASKVYAEKNQKKIDALVYDGTKIISILIVGMVFFIVVNAKTILVLYMGPTYEYLSPWLILWVLSLVGMHNVAITGMIMSTGKTKPLVIMSAISCIVSLPITALLAPTYNMGAASIGYFVYSVMQISFSYLYYIPKVLKFDSLRIFTHSFFPAVASGVAAAFMIYGFNQLVYISNFTTLFIVDSVLFGICYLILIYIFVLKRTDIQFIRSKLSRA